MKKTLMTVTTAGVVVLGSAFFGGSAAHADTVEQLKDRQSQIEADRAEVKANLSDAEAEIADVLFELEELNSEIEKVDNALAKNQQTLDNTETDIASSQKEIDDLEADIAALEEKIEKRFEILKERMVSYQQQGGNISFLEVLFGSQSFGDFVNRVSAVSKIADSDAALMKEQEEDKKAVEAKQEEVQSKLDELKAKKTELKEIQETIEIQKEQNEDKKAALQEKEADLTAMISDLEMEESSLTSLEKEVQVSIEEATAPAVAVADTTDTSSESNTESNESAASSNNSSSSESDSNSGGELTQLSKETDNESKKESKPEKAASSGSGMSAVINAGFAHLGTPYTWNGQSPAGFDCSGFIAWAFAQGGYSVPSYTGGLAGIGTQVSYSEAQPGDLVFFDTYKKNGHVGIYLGGGKFIGAQNSTGLAVADMTSGYWADEFEGHVRRVN
ncbi:NlpC/P60 family protein [Lentibacillus sediminis]|uniref:C40 family peptidase n=1 Tax=Lentibacillus sediminis TaxID=1940529 RepID=UPI001EFCD7C4|nr:C40 family peptidase [Lentibacillus sediminis]